MITLQPRSQATGGQIAKGVAWLMLFKMADKAIGLVSTLILARVLTPADFGLVAMATSVVAFTQLMSAFGFDTALIQRQDARREHFDTSWTFNVMFGVAIALLLAALALPMARFYRDDRLVAILLVLAVGALLGGFENIGTVEFRKHLDFRSEFRFLFFKRIASFAVTVGLALTLRSYWALVAGAVTSQVLSVAISYRMHPFRPRFTLAARADLMHFSKWIFLSSLISFFHNRSTDFILGRTVGSHGLGVYNIASEISAMPSTELIAPINRAVYPAYARLIADRAVLRQRFLTIFGVICMIGLPVAAVLYGVADPAVRLVLGPHWLEAIPLIRIFAISGLLSALSSNLYLVVMAIGQPRANTLLSGGLLVFALPAIVLASSRYGIQGAAYAQLITAILAFMGIVTIFVHLVGIRVGQLAAAAWRPGVSSAATLAVLLALDHLILATLPEASPIVRLAPLLGAALCAYPALGWLLWKATGSPPGAEELVLRLARDKLFKPAPTN